MFVHRIRGLMTHITGQVIDNRREEVVGVELKLNSWPDGSEMVAKLQKMILPPIRHVMHACRPKKEVCSRNRARWGSNFKRVGTRFELSMPVCVPILSNARIPRTIFPNSITGLCGYLSVCWMLS